MTGEANVTTFVSNVTGVTPKRRIYRFSSYRRHTARPVGRRIPATPAPQAGTTPGGEKVTVDSDERQDVTDDVRSLLSQLRTTLESARSMPMSSSAVVNRADLLGLVDRLGQALDRTFAESARLIAARDDVVGDARKEAQLIVHEAEIERDRLVSDTEVFRLAQAKGQETLDDAKREAEALRTETDQYVDGKLANFEITLERTLEAVKRGRDRLSGTTVLHQLTPEEADKIVLPDHLEA